MQEIREQLNKLKNADWWKRKDAIEHLLAYSEDLYLPALEEWLRNDEDALLRNTAIETYRALGMKSAKSLLRLINDEDTDVRIFAVSLIGDIQYTGAVSYLISFLHDYDSNVRIASAESLGKIGDSSALDALAACLNDDLWLAVAAIEAIGQIGGDKALSVLYKCLEREEYFSLVCGAIEKAGDQHSIEHLSEFIKKDNLREHALKAIINIAEKKGMSLQPSSLADLVPLLIELQNSSRDEIRRTAFIALSWSEDIRGLPYFIESLSNDGLQEYAVNGLISLGKKAVPEIINALKKQGSNRPILAKILSMSGDSRALLAFLKDDNHEVRTEVALAIGSLNTPDAKEALLKLQQDDVEEVKMAASLSLKKYR